MSDNDGAPVASGDAVVQEIAERCRSRAGLGTSLQRIIEDAVREGIATGRRTAFADAAAMALDHGAPHIARTITEFEWEIP